LANSIITTFTARAQWGIITHPTLLISPSTSIKLVFAQNILFTGPAKNSNFDILNYRSLCLANTPHANTHKMSDEQPRKSGRVRTGGPPAWEVLKKSVRKKNDKSTPAIDKITTPLSPPQIISLTTSLKTLSVANETVNDVVNNDGDDDEMTITQGKRVEQGGLVESQEEHDSSSQSSSDDDDRAQKKSKIKNQKNDSPTLPSPSQSTTPKRKRKTKKKKGKRHKCTN
jgi:hypothetical protein